MASLYNLKPDDIDGAVKIAEGAMRDGTWTPAFAETLFNSVADQRELDRRLEEVEAKLEAEKR